MAMGCLDQLSLLAGTSTADWIRSKYLADFVMKLELRVHVSIMTTCFALIRQLF